MRLNLGLIEANPGLIEAIPGQECDILGQSAHFLGQECTSAVVTDVSEVPPWLVVASSLDPLSKLT